MSEKESKSTEAISDVSTYLKSSFYEQLVEHTFISELLQEVHYKHRTTKDFKIRFESKTTKSKCNSCQEI